ncbi:uncharacterized protein LOC144632002 [Oculina patagonica]
MKSNWKLFLYCFIGVVILPQFLMARSASPPEHKVLILGAGAAGITAAKTLHDKGITDFLVLEAQDYIGGRMKQVRFAGMKVEEGANWIHFVEEEDNPLNPLKDKYDLKGHMSNYSDLCMRDDFGKDITDLKTFKLWKKTVDKLFEMGEERDGRDSPPRDMPASVGLRMLGWRSNTPMKKAFSWYDIDFEYGRGERETSLNNMGFPGEDFFITDQRGYWTAFSGFYKSFEDKILLNKPVSKIIYSDHGVEVITTGGEKFTAEYALSTFSSGVLGSGSVEFDPPLPEWKKEAILRFRPVYFTKIFLKFPRDFWDDHEWIMHISQKTGHFPIFYDLDRPGFFPGSAALFSVVTGDEALRVEAQDDSKTLEEMMEVLRNMYGSNIPNATDIHVSKWSQNPFVRGSWADPVIGTSWGHYDNMAGRLKNLFFAGENTSSDWYGFVQGGYYTGRDKAREIVKCIKGSKRCKPYKPAKKFI